MAKKSPIYAGDPVLLSLGQTIRRARQDAGLSQEALALETGLDRSYMGGIERGEHNMTLMNLHRIAVALGMSPSRLLSMSGY